MEKSGQELCHFQGVQMTKERLVYLFSEAAKALEDGQSPFQNPFLREHDVTFNECMELSMQVAMVLKSYVKSPPAVQEEVLVRAAMGEAAMLELRGLRAQERLRDLKL